jgi:hypothetical protein
MLKKWNIFKNLAKSEKLFFGKSINLSLNPIKKLKGPYEFYITLLLEV